MTYNFLTDLSFWTYPTPEGGIRIAAVHEKDLTDKASLLIMTRLGAVQTAVTGHGVHISYDRSKATIELVETAISSLRNTYPVYVINSCLGADRVTRAFGSAIEAVAWSCDQFAGDGNVAIMPTMFIAPLAPERAPQKLIDFIRDPAPHKHEHIAFRFRQGVLSYADIGPGANAAVVMGEEWRHTRVDRPFTTGFNDPAFNELAPRTYVEVIETGEPQLTKVDCWLPMPSGRAHWRYIRAVAPLPGQPGVVTSLVTLEPV